MSAFLMTAFLSDILDEIDFTKNLSFQYQAKTFSKFASKCKTCNFTENLTERDCSFSSLFQNNSEGPHLFWPIKSVVYSFLARNLANLIGSPCCYQITHGKIWLFQHLIVSFQVARRFHTFIKDQKSKQTRKSKNLVLCSRLLTFEDVCESILCLLSLSDFWNLS